MEQVAQMTMKINVVLLTVIKDHDLTDRRYRIYTIQYTYTVYTQCIKIVICPDVLNFENNG